MLVINPDECIDCGVCEPECPAEAIIPDSDDDGKWSKVNEEYSAKWPNIVRKGTPPEDGKEFEGVEDKYNKFFSSKPGEGSED